MMTNIYSEVSNVVSNACCFLSPSGLISVKIEESVIESVRNWTIAVGGILVVIVAMFSEWIKGLFKAKIQVSISNKVPHFMCEGVNCCGITNGEIEGKVWLEVRNISKCIASKVTRVAIETIYVRESAATEHCYGKLYEMHPRYLAWSGLVSPKNIWLQIAPRTSEYAHIITIKTIQKSVTNKPDSGNGSEDPQVMIKIPTLVVRSALQEFVVEGDFQDVIVGIRITGNTIKTEKSHVLINWLGKSSEHLKDDPGRYLKCEVINDEDKLRSLLKEGLLI